MEKFTVGDRVSVNNNLPLDGNEIAPDLRLDEDYTIKEIVLDSAGNQHIDVGLYSAYEYVTSYETKERLDRGDIIHWCHPSRFIKISK